jgi:hypothetical protein
MAYFPAPLRLAAQAPSPVPVWCLAQVFVQALVRASAQAVALVALLGAAAGAVRAAEPEVTLVMVEQPGCHYCRAWHAEIGPAYPKTAAGDFAPLRTEQMRAIPDDLDLDRRVLFTPTFVVVDASGTELGRIEGYPGQDFFWPLLEQLLADTAGFTPPTTTPREEETE